MESALTPAPFASTCYNQSLTKPVIFFDTGYHNDEFLTQNGRYLGAV